MSDPAGQKPLDLETLERVVFRLREALQEYDKNPGNLFVLDSVVKRFELAYEVSTRTLRRYLLDHAFSPADVKDKSLQGVLRNADKEGLVQHGWPEWKNFRDARNETAHTYTEPAAREIARIAQPFLVEAEYLLDNLKRRLASHG